MNELIIKLLELAGIVLIQATGIVIGAWIAIRYISKKFSFKQDLNIYINPQKKEDD